MIRYEMLSRLSDEERRQYLMHLETMDALKEIDRKADANHQSFLSDFGANIAGNAVWDGAVYLLSKLFR